MTLASNRDSYALQQPLCESPGLEYLLESSGLSAEEKRQVRQFSEQGFLIVDGVLDDAQVEAQHVIDNLEDKYGKKEYIGNERRLQDAWEFDANVKKLACAPKVLNILETLYQRRPIPFQTLNFPVGTQQMTHSDAIHFHSVPHRFMCGVWVALEDIDADNGPLHYYPGSHKLPVYYYHDLGMMAERHDEGMISQRYAEYEKKMQTVIKEAGLQKTHVTLKRGQALIWSTNLLHGGNAINDPARSRHSQVTHYYFEDCLYYTPRLSNPYLGDYLWRTIRDIQTGEPVVSRYNGRDIHFGERACHMPLLDAAHAAVQEPAAKVNSVTPFPGLSRARLKSALRQVKRKLAG